MLSLSAATAEDRGLHVSYCIFLSQCKHNHFESLQDGQKYNIFSYITWVIPSQPEPQAPAHTAEASKQQYTID